MEEISSITVEPSEDDTRLDLFVSRRLGITRSEAARQIESGNVLVDGKPRKPSFKLKQGMAVRAVIVHEETGPYPEGADIPLSILYEDAHIVVIDKPAGLVVHPGAGTTGPTLVNALIHRYAEIAGVGDPERPGIVHRLDRLTSGVMVAARSAEAFGKLSAAFKAHEHDRVYLAICYGHLGKASGRIETLMQRNPRDRKKMSSKVSEGREAITDWLVVREWDQLSLLELRLRTGRTHQIRVHLSDIGHPVAGDPEYGGKRRANVVTDPVVRSRIKSLGRQMLHAWKLGLTHPVTGERMEFSSEPPEDFQGLVSLLDERRKQGV